MSSIRALNGNRRRQRTSSLPGAIEVLEARMLLAGGITAEPGAPIQVASGVPITNAVFATYTVSDSAGASGTQWLAEIQFGDGQVDKHVVPVQAGDGFEIIGSHTYQEPGTYTVTVMIAVPGSHDPTANDVTTRVTVTVPPSSIGNFVASGLRFRAVANKTFHGQVARFRDPHSKARDFSALIDWGDQSTPAVGQIRAAGRGKFEVVGAHSYAAAGVDNVVVTIQDAAGQEVAAKSSVSVKSKK